MEKVGAEERNRLDELPTVVLQQIASQLGGYDILDRLLPAYPRLGAKLRNGLLWSSCYRHTFSSPEDILDDCRRLPLLSVESMRYYDVSFRPTEPFLVAKWRRIIGGNNLYALAVSHLGFLAHESVSPSLEMLMVKLKASHKGMNSWTLWCPCTQLDLLTKVIVRVEGDSQAAFRILNGDSFFDAFPKATHLTFIPSPSAEFWPACPAVALERINHISLQFVQESDAFVHRASSFVNLQSLELTGCEVPAVLRDLVRTHAVLPRVETLTLCAVDEVFEDKNTWSELRNTFPRLNALDVEVKEHVGDDDSDDDGDTICVRGEVLEEMIPNMFGARANVKIVVPSASLLSCLVMATEFMNKGDDATWELVLEGSNDDENVRPMVTQAMLDLLIKNPACVVELEGTVEPQTAFKLCVKSV